LLTYKAEDRCAKPVAAVCCANNVAVPIGGAEASDKLPTPADVRGVTPTAPATPTSNSEMHAFPLALECNSTDIIFPPALSQLTLLFINFITDSISAFSTVL